MSLIGVKKNKVILSSKKNIEPDEILNEKFNKLALKVTQLEKNKQNNEPQHIKNLEQQIRQLEKKNRQLELSMELSIKEIKEIKNNKPISPVKSSDEIKLLNNIINNDLNKLKIKIEKNESVIKKILFN